MLKPRFVHYAFGYARVAGCTRNSGTPSHLSALAKHGVYGVTTELRPAHRPVHQMVTKRNIPAVTFFLRGSLTLQAGVRSC